MKKLSVLLLLTILGFTQVSGQGENCKSAVPICTDMGYVFNASVGQPAQPGPAYGCLLTQPNPAWYYLKIATAGKIQILMQSTPAKDIDYIVWGPFTSATGACTNGDLTEANIVSCSYSTAPVETATIDNAVVGEYYLLLITNYSNKPCSVTFAQSNKYDLWPTPGSTDCSITTPCVIDDISVSPSTCSTATTTYSVSGTITVSNPPSSVSPPSLGTLVVSVGSFSQVLPQTSFGTTIQYTISGLPADGKKHVVKAVFSNFTNCALSEEFTAPPPCFPCPISSFTYTATACSSYSNSYHLTGQVTFSHAPATGTLYIKDGTNIQVFEPPFTSPTQYKLTIASDGISHNVVADFTDDNLCSFPGTYSAPAACRTLTLPAEECIPEIVPEIGTTYILSAWAKEDPDPTLMKTSYTFPKILVSFPGSGVTFPAFLPKGRIIDGWQRIHESFTVPTGSTDFNIELQSLSGNVYFDDIRIFPANGSMKSFVYDPITLKLVAELDDNNYATFYEYDEEGSLVRVKKETEEGIVTIKETISRNRKKL